LAIFKKREEKVHIQVGLDFGTSATKVIFSQLGKRPFRVLNFNHNLSHYPSYCIPSLGCINENGSLLLGINAARALLDKEWDTGLQSLKVVVAGKYDDFFKDPSTEEKYYDHFKIHGKKPIAPEMITAVFLAYVIHITRKTIKNFPEYRSLDLDFAFNICMPIDHVENSNLKPVFERIFAWAELIENEWRKSGKDFNPLKAARSLENRFEKTGRKIFAVPESVASFASYLVSLRRRTGLHAVIDLGAGTTDLSICNLFLDSGDIKNYWYAARNFPRGTIRIERVLALNIVQIKKQRFCSSSDICKCLESLSTNLNNIEEFQKNKKMQRIIFKELCDFRDSKEYKKTWGSAYRQLRRDTLWKNVEIFTCGGGSKLPHTEEVFSKPWWRNLDVEYRVSNLPVPDNYEPGKSGAPFERMSVAYGLANPFPKFEDYILPNDCPDQTPPPLPVLELDHEDLYTD